MSNSEEKHESEESEIKKQYVRLKDLEDSFEKYFEIEDWTGFRVILGVAAAHYMPGEMLWVKVIGASGSGKTETLRAILRSPKVTTVESITPAAIRGGLPGGKKLLDRLDGKLVITKDMAAMTSARKDIRREVFGLLRNVTDGFFSADFGTRQGNIKQNARFDWILATTGIIDSERQIESLLGERFVDLRWRPGNRLEMIYLAARNNPHLSKVIRPKLKDEVKALMIHAQKLAEIEHRISKEDSRFIAKLADTVSLCRTPVQIDSRTKNLIAMPTPEIGTRLAQSFSRIILGLRLIGIRKWQLYIERIAWDSLPSMRATILRQLKEKPMRVKSISIKTGIPISSVYSYLLQLELLRVVEKVRLDQAEKKGFEIDLNEGQGGELYRLKVELPDYPES